jgi:hypothetical protein
MVSSAKYPKEELMKEIPAVLLLILEFSLALTVAELGKDLIKFLARMFYDKVILWAWAVIR